MFKTNILLVGEDWDIIHQYKSRNVPYADEFIYINSKYHKVVTVIHTPESPNVTVVIKEYVNFNNKG